METKKKKKGAAAPAMKYTVHPAAAAFPLLARKEFGELKKDIDTRGVIEPIIMQGDVLLDGRNRMAACEELGIKPPIEEYKGNDPVGFIIAKNVFRRHLTDDQRVMIVAKIRGDSLSKEAAADKQKGQFGGKGGSEKKGKGETADRLAGEAKTSQHKARQALDVKKHAPELVEEVISGKKKLGKAAKTAKEKKPAKKKANKPEPTLKDTVQKRFIRFMDYWPVTSHREVKKILRELLS